MTQLESDQDLDARIVERRPKKSHDLLDISEYRTYKAQVAWTNRRCSRRLVLFLKATEQLDEEAGSESKETADRQELYWCHR